MKITGILLINQEESSEEKRVLGNIFSESVVKILPEITTMPYINTNCTRQCWLLFIAGLQAANELPRQHWTKRAKIDRWYCTRFKNRLPAIFETATGFPAKICLGALGQYCTSNFLVQCCLRRICSILTRQYSYAVSSQHRRSNSVVGCCRLSVSHPNGHRCL